MCAWHRAGSATISLRSTSFGTWIWKTGKDPFSCPHACRASTSSPLSNFISRGFSRIMPIEGEGGAAAQVTQSQHEGGHEGSLSPHLVKDREGKVQVGWVWRWGPLSLDRFTSLSPFCLPLTSFVLLFLSFSFTPTLCLSPFSPPFPPSPSLPLLPSFPLLSIASSTVRPSLSLFQHQRTCFCSPGPGCLIESHH